MNIDRLLSKHPLPWRMENGDMLDANGLCVRPSYDIIASVAELSALRDSVSLTKDHVAYVESELVALQRSAAQAARDSFESAKLTTGEFNEP